MNRTRTLRTFAFLSVVILSTVGCVTFIGLQLAPIARDIMGQGRLKTDISAMSTSSSPPVTSVGELSPTAAALTISTPIMQIASRKSLTLKPTAASTPAALAETQTMNSNDSTIESAQKRAIVDAPLVNVRSAPSVAGELLIQLQQNKEVQIIGMSDDSEWYQVCCPLGTTAERETWVSADLLRLLPSPANSAPEQLFVDVVRAAANDDNQIAGIVNAALANVRSGPSTQYEIIGQVSEATVLKVSGRTETGAWVQICCPAAGQQNGWISTELLDFVGDTAQALQELIIAPIPPLPTASSPVANSINTAAAITSPAAATTPPASIAPPDGTGPGLPSIGSFDAVGAINPLTGQHLPDGRNGQRPVIVCINNDPAARPQLGLSQADLVYEYLMEGYGITRFSAIFYGTDVGQIGPVRSARLINYYMGALYDAGLVCSGASDQVRYTLKHEAPFPYLDIDLDDPANNRYSMSVGTDYRTRLRTSTNGAHLWLGDKGQERSSSLRSFTFGEAIAGDIVANQIDVPYPSGTGSQVRYQYDATSGQYRRWLGGGAHTDGNTGAQLALDNVIIQYVTHEATDIVEDSLGSTSIRLTLFGSGQALVFRNGLAFIGTWRSDSRGDLPRFYQAGGQEIPLKPGKSWISIVPHAYTISYQ